MSPESTPHISQARTCVADLLTSLREARQAREAEPVRLANLSSVARGLDHALEELETR